MYPPLEPLFQPPLPRPSLGCHRAPVLSSLGQGANSHWLSISLMVVPMFPFYFLHSPHPLLPSPVSISLFSMSVSPSNTCVLRWKIRITSGFKKKKTLQVTLMARNPILSSSSFLKISF